MSADRDLAAPVFVVSTGRCGSTMISNMVRLHPRMLSVSEFFSSLADRAFRGRSMRGRGLARRLGRPGPASKAMLRNGLIVDEYLYPLSPDSRFGPEDVPPIMGAALPHLTGDPEGLWDELEPVLKARRRASLGAQYRFVLEWLATRFRRDIWVERSGASLMVVPALARLFPDARFVHIFRDGRDTAMSMHGHHLFRLLALAADSARKIGLDPFRPVNWPGTSPWRPVFARIVFPSFSSERFQARELDLPLFGWLWSSMIERGTRYLDALPRDRVLAMRFETILRSPRAEMQRFIDFAGPEFSDSRWLDRITGLPRVRPPSWQRLTPEEHANLAQACAPGQEILGYDNLVAPC